MNKKVIALAILAFVFLVPFQWCFININFDRPIVSAISMTATILLSLYSIYLYTHAESK